MSKSGLLTDKMKEIILGEKYEFPVWPMSHLISLKGGGKRVYINNDSEADLDVETFVYGRAGVVHLYVQSMAPQHKWHLRWSCDVSST